MSVEEIRSLPVEQKMQLLDALWEDMLERFEKSKIYPEHIELLRARRERVESGASKLLDWDQVKSSLGRA